MTSEFEMSEQSQSRPTRRLVVATGVKLAYAVPIVAASFKVSAINALAGVSGGIFCGHSTGTNGGCKGACTSALKARGFENKGYLCNAICGDGQTEDTGACPPAQSGDNPCCNPGYCDPDNYKLTNTGFRYSGPTAGCPA